MRAVIVLERSLGDLLDAIGASPGLEDAPDHPPHALPAELAEGHVVAQAVDRHDVLPALRALLRARFPHAHPRALGRDVLRPLRRAIGNAERHAHAGSRGLRMRVEAWLTPHGLVLGVSDRGAGFDVAETLHRLRAGERYAAHQGSGFRDFEKARSEISYAARGRTWLLGWRCPALPATESLDPSGPPAAWGPVVGVRLAGPGPEVLEGRGYVAHPDADALTRPGESGLLFRETEPPWPLARALSSLRDPGDTAELTRLLHAVGVGLRALHGPDASAGATGFDLAAVAWGAGRVYLTAGARARRLEEDVARFLADLDGLQGRRHPAPEPCRAAARDAFLAGVGHAGDHVLRRPG